MSISGTNVPSVTFGAAGFVAPSQQAILAGLQADFQAAFGGNLNTAPSTPQGQLITSLTAIIGDCYDQMVALFNGMDPAYAQGRQQDGVGRIYFQTRLPATATVATCVCAGLNGVTIPLGALAQDQAQNYYVATQSGTITNGSVTLTFACQSTGSIACPAGFVNAIAQAIPGWDSVTNPVAGVVGSAVESRYAFETRRQQSVAVNAQGTCPAILGALYAVPGVLDAYVSENVTSSTTGASIIGSLAGGTLSVTTVLSGVVAVGQLVAGTAGVGGTQGGPILGTTITGLGSGTGGVGTYTIDTAQSVVSGTLTCALGGTRLAPNSIYAAAYGGSVGSICYAIWSKKSPGCNYNGNTTGTVTDPSPQYGTNAPTYQVTYMTPATVPIGLNITMVSGVGAPANAASLVQAAVVQAFLGLNGTPPRARMGSTILAYQFASAILALGTWAQLISITIGVAGSGNVSQPWINVPINLEPTIQTSNISVTFMAT